MAIVSAVSDCLPLPLNQYVGVYFRPTDEQILQYLYSKIHGFPYFQGAVFDCDLYGASEPWEIWDFFKGADDTEDLYFFTKLKRSTTKNSRQLSAHINRKIGLANGTWSGENSATPIFPERCLIESQPTEPRAMAPERCLTESQPVEQRSGVAPERCLTESHPAEQREVAPETEMIYDMPDVTIDFDTLMELLETEPNLATGMDYCV